MRQTAWIVAEILLLFGALFFSLPYIPSHEMERLPLMPGAALAVLLFAASRLVRWRRRFLIAVAETLLFAGFVFVAHQASNILYMDCPTECGIR